MMPDPFEYHPSGYGVQMDGFGDQKPQEGFMLVGMGPSFISLEVSLTRTLAVPISNSRTSTLDRVKEVMREYGLTPIYDFRESALNWRLREEDILYLKN